MTSRPEQTSTGPRDDTLLDLLALQDLGGGFPLDQLADLAGIPTTTLTAAAQQAARVTSDAERLVATAIALALLHIRYPGHTTLWAPLIRKSQTWLTDTLASTPITIDQQPLRDWATHLITKLDGTPR